MANSAKETVIRIYGREKTRQDGSKYVEYSYTKDGETFYRVSFTQECMIRPTKVGYWLIKVNSADISLKKAQTKTTTDGKSYTKNPVMFIANVLDKPIEDKEYANQMAEIKQAAVDELLGL